MTTALLAAAGAMVAALLIRPRSSRGRLRVVLPGACSTDEPAASQTAGRWRSGRDARLRAAETVEVVFALAAELRAGRPPGRALALVSSASELLRVPLGEAAAAVEAGARPGEELARISTVPGCAGLQAVAAAWTVTESAGGAVADVVDRLGDVLENERQARDALDAALAGPRATMALLAGLPVLGLLLGESLGAHPVSLPVHRPLGWALLVAGGILDGLGVAWTRLLVRRALR